MRILITGVSGFLGRHMARRLLAQGHEVTGLARHAPGSLVSIDEPCEPVAGISGRPLERRIIRTRAVDPPRILLDSRRALLLLGWSAQVPIGEGLALTWRWWQERT